jgi:hypothetical protein
VWRLNIVKFTELIEAAELSDTSAATQEKTLVIMNHIAYGGSPDARNRFIEVLELTSVDELIHLFEELHAMEIADNGVDDYDSSNAYQTLMEINRSVGLHSQVVDIPSMRKRRLI